MPVLGHAFVGAATALCAPPNRAGQGPGDRMSRLGAALWIPIVVVVAYLPDIAAQLALLAGWPDARVATHSLVSALLAAPLVAWGITALVPVTYRRAFAVSAVSIITHDLLDLAQGTDRDPWWPVAASHTHAYSLVPSEPMAEALLFGLGFAAFMLVRAWRRGRPESRANAVPPVSPGLRWIAWVATGLIIAAAGVTHTLRALRERQLSEARLMVESHSYRAALALAAQAEHWPSTARPGRIDHVRGEAYAGLGERQQAESAFHRSMAADPSYFWAFADLADLYASLDEPAEERRRLLAAPLIQLRTTFATHPALPQVLARLDRKLAPLGLPRPASPAPR